MILGERIYLAAIDSKNAETFRAWVNDREVNRWLATGHIPLTREAELKFVQGLEKSPDSHQFQIHIREDDRLIGICGMDHKDPIHRHGVIGIAIGEKDAQNRGYGADVLRTLLRFGFDTLGLHTVAISAFEGNERSLHLYRKLGFKECGRSRDRVFLRGRFHDAVKFDMLESEFREMYGDAR